MGYISEVNIYIRETDENGIILEEIIKKSNLAEKLDDYHFTIGKNSEGNRVLHFEHQEIKWYSHCKLIQFWTFLMNQLDENDYLFVRLGESIGDFETEGEYGEASAYTTYEIHTDFEEEI
jgi:hypothetical protein